MVPQVQPSGAVTLSDVPFKPGTDFSVFDHLKYIGISAQTFTVPKVGTVTFEVDIFGEHSGRDGGPRGARRLRTSGSLEPRRSRRPALRGDGARGAAGRGRAQHDRLLHRPLFDWFVSGGSAFPLIERLPTSVTGNTRNPGCPGATEVGLDKAYTQIIKNIPLTPGRTHHVAISFSRSAGQSSVAYALDGQVVATVGNVGIPLDQQGNRYAWTGTYPSLGKGEKLADQINSLSIGHGLFSLLDAFPFQYGCSPATTSPGAGACSPESAAYSVSLSPAERSFGQGAEGVFSGFRVTTTGR